MHFTSLFGLACLTASTFAAPINQAPQDTVVIERSVQNISNTLKGLTTAIRDLDAFSRRGSDTNRQEADIERRAGDVTNALRDAASQIRRIQPLNTIEAASIVDNIEELGATTQRTVDAWILAKPSVVKSGGRQAVLKLLAAQETATDEFTDTLVAKMPVSSVLPARFYAQRARVQVDQAIAAFKLL